MILRREIIDFSNIFVQCKKERVLRFFDPYCDVTKTILEPPVHKLRCVQQTRFFSYHKIINYTSPFWHGKCFSKQHTGHFGNWKSNESLLVRMQRATHVNLNQPKSTSTNFSQPFGMMINPCFSAWTNQLRSTQTNQNQPFGMAMNPCLSAWTSWPGSTLCPNTSTGSPHLEKVI